MPEQDIHTRFETLMRFIDEAIDDVGNDILVSMDALERDVEILCKDLANSSAALANDMKPAMADTIDRLDALAQALGEFQMRMKERKNKKGGR